MSDNEPTITGVPIVCAYVDDFQSATRFYEELLGLSNPSSMGDNACFYNITDDVGLYLEGGNTRVESTTKSTRPSFILRTASASKLYDSLKEAGVQLLHPAPSPMGGDNYWFMLADPAGNIIEILGGP